MSIRSTVHRKVEIVNVGVLFPRRDVFVGDEVRVFDYL